MAFESSEFLQLQQMDFAQVICYFFGTQDVWLAAPPPTSLISEAGTVVGIGNQLPMMCAHSTVTS